MKQNKIVSIELNSFSSAFEETITEECCGGALESELTYLQSWFKYCCMQPSLGMPTNLPDCVSRQGWGCATRLWVQDSSSSDPAQICFLSHNNC